MNWQDWHVIELAQVLVFFWHGKSCSMLFSFLLWTGTGNMIPGRDRIPGSRNTAASATKNPLDTRFAASAKVQLFQLSTLRRRQSSLIWTLARMETVKTMVFAQWSLADTCMPALPSVLVIDMNWIAAWTPHQLARLARHWTSTGAYILLARQKLFNDLLIPALKCLRQCFPCIFFFVQIHQCCADNHKRIVRIWVTQETDHMGTWSLRPIVDGMDCCSPNGSVGCVAMGKWPIRPYDCTNLSEILKT